MIVVELDPVQQSFEPWDVVADENGNFQTSWYVYSEEFQGATFQATATGQTSQLTASARFTDSGAFSYSLGSQSLSATAGGAAVSFSQSVTAPAGNGNFTATLQVAGTGTPIPPSWVSTSPASLSFSTGGGPDTKSWTVSFTVPANAACGTYTANIKANASISGVGPGPGTAVTLTVTGCASPTPTATAASPTPTPTPTPTNAPPVALCQNVTVPAGANCTANASIDNGSYDPDSGDTTTVSQSPAGPYSLGNTSVTLTVTDNHGASSTCSATVTVEDNTNPAITGCPSDITVYTGSGATTCDATASWTAPTASDNCPGVSLGSNHNPGDTFPVGPTTVTYTATDGAGNTATCSFTVTVVDNTDPVISGCPSNITVYTGSGATTCDATASWTAPTASDNCPGVSLGSNHNPGDTFPLGPTTVTYTATDGAGNTATCSFTVTVVDNTNPVIAGCPANITVYTGAGNTMCSQTASWTAPTASDNCPGVVSLTSNHNPGDTFPVGPTTVTYTATDGAGNTATCSFTVTVVDNTNPVITGCPANITVYTGPGNTMCSQTASWTAPTASDNCPGVSLGSNHNPGDTFPVGPTTVTYTATDGAGNTATCSFTVTVVDNTVPVITGCPANITVYTGAGNTMCSQTASWTAPSASDNCPGVSLTSNHNPGDTFPVGMTTVTYTATDGVGLTATCSFNVTVVDNTPPAITHCPPDRAITATCPTTVPNLTGEVTATDNCGGAVTVTQTPVAGTQIGVGTTTVTLHVKDALNNEATCTATLTVSYSWNGFFPPVDNIPVINRVKAGSAIPVKFSLGCNQGLNIFWAGYPQSGQMNCNTQLPEDDIEQTVNAGGSSLNYDPVANQYIYVWKTDRSWAGTCRQLTVRFADGTYQYAFFNFTR
jgi:HYR domain